MRLKRKTYMFFWLDNIESGIAPVNLLFAKNLNQKIMTSNTRYKAFNE